jgi:hypothetical protein
VQSRARTIGAQILDGPLRPLRHPNRRQPARLYRWVITLERRSIRKGTAPSRYEAADAVSQPLGGPPSPPPVTAHSRRPLAERWLRDSRAGGPGQGGGPSWVGAGRPSWALSSSTDRCSTSSRAARSLMFSCGSSSGKMLSLKTEFCPLSSR